jgi:hypothetical protein
MAIAKILLILTDSKKNFYFNRQLIILSKKFAKDQMLKLPFACATYFNSSTSVEYQYRLLYPSNLILDFIYAS